MSNQAEPVADFPDDLVFPGDEPAGAQPAPVAEPVMKVIEAPDTPLSVIPGMAAAGVETGRATAGKVPSQPTMTESCPAVPGLTKFAKPSDKRAALMAAVGGSMDETPMTHGVSMGARMGAPKAPEAAPQVFTKSQVVERAPKPIQRTKRSMDPGFLPGQEVKDLMILRPAYKLVDDLVAHATLALFDKPTMSYEARRGDAVIDHTRNYLTHQFMQSGYEWALWWDDDMIPPVGNPGWSKQNVPGIPDNYPDNFLRLNPIDRLRSHKKTIVGGLYYARGGNHVPVCQRTDIEALRKAPNTTLLPRDWVGTGFLLTHRSVFEDMQKKFPELAPKQDSQNPWERVWQYFYPDKMHAEDVSFCARAREAGHQPYVDCSVVVFHLGTTAFGPWDYGKAKK